MTSVGTAPEDKLKEKSSNLDIFMSGKMGEK
jgi:hypothetical protein